MSISDTIDEESDISDDDSNTSDESSNYSDERSVGDDAAENDLPSVSIENSVQDDEIQNFQSMLDAIRKGLGDDTVEKDLAIENPGEDDEIHDIQAMLDAIRKGLGDGEDDEFLEMQAMLVDSMEDELVDSDSGYDMEQAADIDESDVIQEVIIGLGPQKTAQQKIYEWFEKMV